MEGLAEPASVLVSENTYKLVRDFFDFEQSGKLDIKGKEEPVEAYKLVKAGEVETRIGAAAVRGLTKFVGRSKKIAALQEAFEKVRSRSGQVLGIVGEAGVGKSRLLLEFRVMLPRNEYTYLEGRCLHYGGSMAYLPILDILKSYFEINEEDREDSIKRKLREKIFKLDDSLENVLPPFQELLSLQVDDETYLRSELQERKQQIFEAIRDFLVRESQNQPIVMAVEDLHWADRTSEEFLDYLIGWLPNTSILLILLYRPEYGHQWGSKSYYSKIGLDQLSTQTSA
jgi:predicted ATPase